MPISNFAFFSGIYQDDLNYVSTNQFNTATVNAHMWEGITNIMFGNDTPTIIYIPPEDEPVKLFLNGDETITVNGTGNKTIDGGSGTDSLTISYGSISSLTDFTITEKRRFSSNQSTT